MLFKTSKHDWLKNTPLPINLFSLFHIYYAPFLKVMESVNEIEKKQYWLHFLMKDCVIRFFIGNDMITNPTKPAHTALHYLSFFFLTKHHMFCLDK